MHKVPSAPPFGQVLIIVIMLSPFGIVSISIFIGRFFMDIFVFILWAIVSVLFLFFLLKFFINKIKHKKNRFGWKLLLGLFCLSIILFFTFGGVVSSTMPEEEKAALKAKAKSEAAAASKAKAKSEAAAASKAKAKSEAAAASKAKAKSEAAAASKAKAKSEAAAASKAKAESEAAAASKKIADSKEDLKAALTIDGMVKENYFNIESDLLEYAKYNDIIIDGVNDPHSRENQYLSKEFKITQNNIKKLIKENKKLDLSKADKRILTKSDVKKLKNYKKKLRQYLSNLYDYAVIYQLDVPVINDPDTESADIDMLKEELQQYQEKFEQAKQEWIAAYDAIMNS